MKKTKSAASGRRLTDLASNRSPTDAALATSECRYRRLFESAKDGILILDAGNGMVLDVNPFLIVLLGYSHEEFVGKAIWDLGFFQDAIANRDNFLELQENGYIRYENLPLETAGGRHVNVEFVSNVYTEGEQNVIQCNIRDITHRKQAEKFHEMGREILQILNASDALHDSIMNVLDVLKTQTGFDAVGLRLQDGDDYPYCGQLGFSEDFLRTENSLVECGTDGGLGRDRAGKICMEGICGLVISGKTDPVNPLFTPGGSFWTNDASPLLELPTGKDSRLHPRNECIHRGYASMALVPIRNKDRIVGLIQLNDRRKGLLNVEMIELLEEMATHLGEAFMRIRAEESMALFRTLLDQAVDAIVVVDPHTGRFLDVNEAGCRNLGYAREEFLTLRVTDIDPVIDPAAWPTIVEEIRQSGNLLRQSTHRRKNGSTFPVEIRVSMARFEQDYLVATVRDITQQKQKEEARRQSEERFRILFEQAADIILQLEIQPGKCPVIRDVNNAAIQILGYERDELIGRPVSCIEAETDTWKVVAGMHQNALPGTGVVVEVRHRCKDGTIRDFECSVTQALIGAKNVYISCERDITERKQASLALETSEKRFRDIADHAQEWIWETDAEAKYTYASQVVEKIMGYTPEEILRKHFYDLFHPDDKEALRAAVMAAFAAKQPLREFIHRNRHKNGQTIWLATSGLPVLDNQGNLLGYRGLDVDITEHKKAEEEHEKLQNQLLQAQKMESAGRLAGGVAHDFNNMLNIILGHVGLALDRVSPTGPLVDSLHEIQEAANRSADLVRQLMAFARKQDIEPQILNPNENISSMLVMLRKLIGEDIKLIWQPGAALRTIKIDPSQFNQILTNLCVNARDAIVNTGTISLETGNVVIDADYCAAHVDAVPGAYIFLTVSDDGSGIDQTTLEHIFEPFFTTKAVGKGTGLGLATVYGIVKQNGGFVYVYSEPDRGTIFRIYLPQTEEKAVKMEAPAPPATPLGRGETILLVEDNPMLHKVYQQFTDGLGYTLLSAKTPEEALQLSGQHPEIHLLLTDVVMPGMNGRQLSEKIRESHPETQVLFMSGYTADILSDRGVQEDHTDFIAKPFSRAALASKLRALLDSQLR